MKKAKTIMLGFVLSLSMAVSGMAGAAAQLQPVYADADTPEISIVPYTYGVASTNPGGIAKKGFSFQGWFADYGCTVAVSFENNTDPNATVYAKYVERISTDASEDEEVEETEEEDTVLAEGTGTEINEEPNEEPYAEQTDYYGATDVTDPDDTVSDDPTDSSVTDPEAVAPGENVNVTPAEENQEDNTESAEIPAGTEDETDTEKEAEKEISAEVDPAEVTVPADENASVKEETASDEEKTEEAAEAAEEKEAAPAEDEAEDAKEDNDLQKAGEKYKVTFDVQGHGTAPETQEVESGKTATKPEDPSAEGYDFGGWFADKDCTTAFDFSKEIKADTTVYAKWTIKTFTVTFSTTRGTAPAAQTVNYGEKATQPTVTDTGYTCTGWTTSDGKTFDFSEGIRTNLTLTAVWRPNVYKIHFDPNNVSYASATGATADMSCTYDKEATLSKNGFARNADWEFIGWNTAANRSGTAYANQATVKNLTATDGATVTLYAQWRFIYKVLSGAGASVSKLDTRGLTFQTNGIYGLFTGIAVDGTVVAGNNYTSSAGSYGTFVTLKQDFIKNLSIGQHTIQFLYQDGSVSCVFYVNNSTILNPVQTGDSSNNALWMSLLTGAAVLAVGLVILKKKYRF